MISATFTQLLFIFMVYAILGWIWEVSYVFTRDLIIKKEAKFVNIGGLVGPYAPIYGVGLILITLATPYIINFLETIGVSGILMTLSQVTIILLIASTLEYTTSYLLEKIFNTRWWDYTHTTLVNINGRVCMSSALFFGIGGYLMFTYVNPALFNVYDYLTNLELITVLSLFYIVFLTDTTIKLFQLFKINPVVRALNTVQKASSDTHKRIINKIRNIRDSKKDIDTIKKELDIDDEANNK